MTIGERIKERRKALGISINALSQSLGKNRATIYRYENNEIENIPMTILKPLSEILQTTPEYLCGFETLPANQNFTEESSFQLSDCIQSDNKKKASSPIEDNLFKIDNFYMRQLLAASQNMTNEQIAHICKYAEFMFPEAFRE